MVDLEYAYPLYRPMRETESVTFQVTLGCSFNKCSFCSMYRTKEYSERPWEEIKKEIDLVSDAHPQTSRIFLADGDALNLSTEKLVQILRYLKQKFESLQSISIYAMPKNLHQKSHEELTTLNREGLNTLYLGIETGYDVLLKKITKGATSKSIISACNKAKESGFSLTCYVILGLGGKKYSTDHIKETARIVSQISPNIVVARPLVFHYSIYEEFMQKFGEPFEQLENSAIFDEVELFLQLVNPTSSMLFRANDELGNSYSISGKLPKDKDRMISLTRELKRQPELSNPGPLLRLRPI